MLAWFGIESKEAYLFQGSSWILAQVIQYTAAFLQLFCDSAIDLHHLDNIFDAAFLKW